MVQLLPIIGFVIGWHNIIIERVDMTYQYEIILQLLCPEIDFMLSNFLRFTTEDPNVESMCVVDHAKSFIRSGRTEADTSN